MVELVTEVCVATIQLYLEKSEEERTEKLIKLAKESVKILAEKQDQLTERDKEIYQQGLALLL